jgi:hypothetical protein
LETLQLRFVELAHPVTPSEEDDLDASLANLLRRDDENSATNRALFRAFYNHPSLKEVTLAQLRLEEGVGLNSLIRGLATIPHLQTVKLHLSVQRQQERRHIRVEGPDNNDDANHNRLSRYLLSASLNPLAMVESLETLELSSLLIRDEVQFLKTLQNHATLKHLSLSHAELSFSGWATLAQMLQRGPRQHHPTELACVSLESLQLDNVAGLDDSTLQLLSRALSGSHEPSLKMLRLLNIMDMGVVGWKAVAAMMATNESIRSLSLENCQGMDDDAVVGIAQGLKSNTTLRLLEMQVFAGHCKQFSQDVGQQAFVELLRAGQNITLHQLYTQAKGNMEEQLELYLGLNRSGLRPYVLEKQLPTNASTLGFWELLEKHNEDLDTLFYVLQTNPPFVMACLRSL